MTDSVQKFFSSWGDDNTERQATTIGKVLAENVRYVDPRTEAPLTSSSAIAAYVSQFTQMAPGSVAEAIDVSSRDGIIRATVAFRMPNGMEQIGQYFIEQNAAGKLTRFVGFVGTGS